MHAHLRRSSTTLIRLGDTRNYFPERVDHGAFRPNDALRFELEPEAACQRDISTRVFPAVVAKRGVLQRHGLRHEVGIMGGGSFEEILDTS